MKEINVIQIPFYEFHCDEILVKKIQEEVNSLEYFKDGETNGYISPNYYHKELFAWFDSCIEKVAKQYFVNTLKFPIVDCWVNKYKVMNNLKKHGHAHSAISGCYYVTTHDSGNTVFEHPNPWTYNKGFYNNLSFNINNAVTLEGEIKPVAGTLILFPPNLYHYMKTYNDKSKIRYTIAFNTFPSGMISNLNTSKLEIKSISVEEKINLEKTK